jgi:DNA modification methylase
MGYRVLIGDCIESMRGLPDQSVHTCVTSPPYFGLRDYGMPGQIGLEETPEAFVARLVEVFREVRRVLRDDGTLWLNLGDSFAKDKNLLGIPWRVAFALQANGWFLRQDIIWHKPNPMPESVTDRCTKAHEYIFLLSKSARYFYDADAIKEASAESSIARLSQPTLDQQAGSTRVPGKTNGNMKAVGGETRNRRSVWTVTTKPFKGAHFATFPPDLIEPCILAGCPVGGTVLDPFGGSGTTAGVALRNSRNAILCELNPTYAAMMHDRVSSIAGGLFAEAAE